MGKIRVRTTQKKKKEHFQWKLKCKSKLEDVRRIRQINFVIPFRHHFSDVEARSDQSNLTISIQELEIVKSRRSDEAKSISTSLSLLISNVLSAVSLILSDRPWVSNVFALLLVELVHIKYVFLIWKWIVKLLFLYHSQKLINNLSLHNIEVSSFQVYVYVRDCVSELVCALIELNVKTTVGGEIDSSYISFQFYILFGIGFFFCLDEKIIESMIQIHIFEFYFKFYFWRFLSLDLSLWKSIWTKWYLCLIIIPKEMHL